MLPPGGGRISTTPAIRSSPAVRTPARSLTFIAGDRTPPASARTASLIPRPVSQKKPTRRPSRAALLSTKTSSERDNKVKPLPTLTSTLEDEEVRENEEPSPPPPPPVEGSTERDEKPDDYQREVPDDLDRTLQQEMIANEINELNNVQPPTGFVSVSRSLETIMEDARCKIVCKQEFMAAPPKPIEAATPRTPPWITYCSLVLLVLVFMLVACLTICTVIINYDRLMQVWDPSYVVEVPVRENVIKDLTGFELMQRWLEEIWQNLLSLVSSGKSSIQ